ncbi:twin-arginine translocase TatA/TatE family subunit [Planctomycetota bacterium]
MSQYATQFIAFMGLPGGSEWIIILLVALLLFGRRLPEIARNMGKSMTEFKKGLNEAQETRDEIVNDVDKLKADAINEVKQASGIDESKNI